MPSEAGYLDLDTGNFVEAHPPGDLFFPMGESDPRARAGLDMVAVAVEPERWDATPDEILREVNEAIPQKQVRIGGSESKIITTEPKPKRAWFFTTREGATGALQITPHSKKSGAVDIRYKLVRARREFGPVSTLLLPSAAGSKRFFNLTDGKSYSEIPAKDQVAYLDHDPKDGWRLIIEGIYNYHTEPEKGTKLWESMSAEEIAQPAGLAAAPFERKGFYRVRSQDLPSVVLIPQWGLLRIAELIGRRRW
jgi:hypothetical protein